MNINIVTVQSGWILQKIAERVGKALIQNGINTALSTWPIASTNNFYVDIQNCYMGPTGGNDVGLFTHVHENRMENVPPLWYQIDFILHMSSRSYWQFAHSGKYPVLKMDVQMPGEVDPAFTFKKPTIGIVQRGQYEGKGFHFLLDFVNREKELVRNFDWLFVGGGWEPVVNRLASFGCFTDSYDDKHLSWPKDYKVLYDEIDYLLIPSKWEGGPMSMIEAAACGVKIISADVGWAGAEIPVWRIFNEKTTLIRPTLDFVLEEIISPTKKAREAVEKLSYDKYAKKLIEIFRMLNATK